MRLRHSTTGVVVNVRDDKPMVGSWEPVTAGSQHADEPDDGTHVCEVCGFEAKTAAGLSAHARKHEE